MNMSTGLPADDSSFQWSAPGGGTTEDPAQTLSELFERMVTRHEDKAETHALAYAEAKSVLESEADAERRIVPEDQATAFAEEFSRSAIAGN